MTNYSNRMARRTGTASMPTEPSGFFETMKSVPARLFTQRARTPVMFGSLGSHCTAWYGNEPEAKAAGGSSLQSAHFGFASADSLSGFSQDNMTGIALGIAALYFLTRSTV